MRIVYLLLFLLFCACGSQIPERKLFIDQRDSLMPVLKTPLLSGDDTIPDERILALYINWQVLPAENPVAGTYKRENDTLYYTPYADLGQGLLFEARLFSKTRTIVKVIGTPVKRIILKGPRTVEVIFPLNKTVPENILMFHVLFSQPMENDEMAFQKVWLLDHDGKVKERVWRERSYWTPDGKHLVLMIHPGRIKRGINYLEELGPVFEVGKKYTLVISDSLRCINGQELQKEYRTELNITSADRTIPQLKTKKIPDLEAGTQTGFLIMFNEVMDYGTMISDMYVIDKDGNIIEGKVRSEMKEYGWVFSPVQPWKAGIYSLVLDNEVADLASNRLYKAFETKDLKADGGDRTTRIKFQVK